MALTLIQDSMIEGGGGGGEDPNAKSIFDTKAALAAASPSESVTVVFLMGCTTTGDGGQSIWVRKETPIAVPLAVVTCANGAKFELATDEANIKMFGAIASGSQAHVTQNKAAFDAAIAYAKLRNISVFIPPGRYVTTRLATIDYAVVIRGTGNRSFVILYNETTELFRIDASAGIIGLQMKDFAVQLTLAGGTVQTACAIRVVGGTNSSLGWSNFIDIDAGGFYAFMISEAGSHATAFGNEGPVSWCRFEGIQLLQAGNYALYGFVFNTGSGTGNEFIGTHGFIHNWVWLYQAGGGIGRVVGDILVMAGHYGSYGGSESSIFVVGGNMQYRSRIRLQGLQADAGMSNIFQLSNTGNPSFSEVIADVLRGGGCAWGHFPQLISSSLGFSRSNIAAM